MMEIRKAKTGRIGDLWHSLMVGAALFAIIFAANHAQDAGKEYLSEQETLNNPVVGRLTITDIRPVAGGSEISAVASKYRDCKWRETRWYLGDRDGNSVPLASARHLDPPTLRGPGILTWDRIFVPVPVDVIEDGTFADTYHLCDGRRVRSEFYR